MASGPSLVLELLLRRPSRCVDVPVPVGPQFRPQRFQFQDLRPLKHVLDGRYGSWSRLIQFCFVGASGMVVDLTFYALFQWLLSFTRLASVTSPRFGFSWNLAIAGALSIAIALLWNFTLNRRLTFNDARGGSWIRQFLTYALSNALAIALSFTVRLYLPTRVGFFARHRLAAAVVGIVGATGISFSMSRWIVFTRRPEPKRRPPWPASPRSARRPCWLEGSSSVRSFSRSGRLTGLTRWPSHPASLDWTRSPSWPQPVSAMMVTDRPQAARGCGGWPRSR